MIYDLLIVMRWRVDETLIPMGRHSVVREGGREKDQGNSFERAL